MPFPGRRRYGSVNREDLNHRRTSDACALDSSLQLRITGEACGLLCSPEVVGNEKFVGVSGKSQNAGSGAAVTTTPTGGPYTKVRAGTAALLELDRCVVASFGVTQPAATMLAVLDGAGEPMTPSQISDRVLVASASTTATLDLLERRGWARRTPNPNDRRSTLVEITDEGRAVADQFLAGVRQLERDALDRLSPVERRQLLGLLGKIIDRVAELATSEPTPLEGRRTRPARLKPPPT